MSEAARGGDPVGARGAPPAPRAAIVIPCYQAARTVERVVERARALGLPIVAVDDGSTDGTGDRLDALARAGALAARPAHATNRGKGAAIATGGAAARALGCTHAVTIDADGQHRPEDVPALLAASQRCPLAMICGVRDLASGDRTGAGRARGTPASRLRRWKSRLLRAHSNAWMRLVTGRWMADSQSGFRVYPLDLLERLALVGERYDWELEVLVEAARAGVELIEVPVACDYPPDAGTRFRLVSDSWRCVRTWARALASQPQPQAQARQQPRGRRP